MENPQTIQFTNECIKGTYNFAETLYTNICTGATEVVKNGFWDYILYIIILFLISAIVLAIKKTIID